jgi:hypothetical protein
MIQHRIVSVATLTGAHSKQSPGARALSLKRSAIFSTPQLQSLSRCNLARSRRVERQKQQQSKKGQILPAHTRPALHAHRIKTIICPLYTPSRSDILSFAGIMQSACQVPTAKHSRLHALVAPKFTLISSEDPPHLSTSETPRRLSRESSQTHPPYETHGHHSTNYNDPRETSSAPTILGHLPRQPSSPLLFIHSYIRCEPRSCRDQSPDSNFIPTSIRQD